MEKTTQVQVENSSIEHILRPISYFAWFLGVGIAHPRKCPKGVTIIIRIIHWALCSISLVYAIRVFMYYKIFMILSDVFAFIFYIKWLLGYMSMYYYIYYGISQYDQWSQLMDKMKKLDQKIKREISMDDQPIKYIEATAILAVFVCFPLYPIILIVHNYFTKSQSFFIKWNMFYYYMLAQVLINSFLFDVVVYVLYYRFQTINKLIGQLNVFSDAQRIALQIRRIRKFHNGICDLIVTVNDIYGVQLFLWLMNCIITVLTGLFHAYDYLLRKEYYRMIMQNIECILYVIQFCVKCWICTLARQESERSGIIIYGFLLNCENLNEDYIENEVNSFAIQLQQHQVAFTAYGFFNINNSLFLSFVGITITHLIFLIQFYEACN